jgi:hypothetical protein
MQGTCVNNEYTVQFHKGAFDLDAIVCPVAIKYNKASADAYWHSRAQSFVMHLIYLMTRWSLEADVWYLEPRSRRSDQTAVEFANEVKAEISATAKLKNLSWDGYFKAFRLTQNFAPPVEKQDRMKQIPRRRYGAVLLNRLQNTKRYYRRHSVNVVDLPSYSQNASTPVALNWRTDEQANIAKNNVLVALQDTDMQSKMFVDITNQRKNVVDTWKQATRKRDTESVNDQTYNRRLEYATWRTWFKQRLVVPERYRQPSDSSSSAIAPSSVLNRVSSYLSNSSFFKLDSSDSGFWSLSRSASASLEEKPLQRTHSLGDVVSSFTLSLGWDVQTVEERRSSLNSC